MSDQWFQSETVEESLYVLISKAFAKHEKKDKLFLVEGGISIINKDAKFTGFKQFILYIASCYKIFMQNSQHLNKTKKKTPQKYYWEDITCSVKHKLCWRFS